MLLTASIGAQAKTIYVSPSGSDQNPGTSASVPLRTIAAASARATAGDTVYLLAGQYNEAIVPANSGTATAPITYRSATDSPAVISNVKIGILVSSKAYLVLDGISINGGSASPDASVNTFVVIQNSHHVTIRNGNFRYANGWSGVDISGQYSTDGRYWGSVSPGAVSQGTTSYITIENNVIDNVGQFASLYGDVVQVAYGTVRQILIQHNTLRHGGHDLVEMDSDNSVLQDNTLDNSYADLTGGDTGYRSIEVRGSYNVVQSNFMAHARVGGDGRYAPLASIRGKQNIVRWNVFFDAINGGIQTWCGTGPGDSTAIGNGRIYNNTFDQLGGSAWAVWAYTGCDRLGSFAFVNNLVVNTRSAVGTTMQNGATVPDADLFLAVSGGDGLTDMGTGPTGGAVARGNLFAPANGTVGYVILAGAGGRMTIDAAAAQNPLLFSKNVNARPVFVAVRPALMADFQLQPSSPGVGAGVFLTTASGSGNTKRLPVHDSLYFSDGNGLLPGDTIQLQGTTQTATVVAIDRVANILTLSVPLTFSSGQGVALAYAGAAPDVGAPVGGVDTKRPLAPSGVTIRRPGG